MVMGPGCGYCDEAKSSLREEERAPGGSRIVATLNCRNKTVKTYEQHEGRFLCIFTLILTVTNSQNKSKSSSQTNPELQKSVGSARPRVIVGCIGIENVPSLHSIPWNRGDSPFLVFSPKPS